MLDIITKPFNYLTDKAGDFIYNTGAWDMISNSPAVQRMADAGQLETSGGPVNFVKGVWQGTTEIPTAVTEVPAAIDQYKIDMFEKMVLLTAKTPAEKTALAANLALLTKEQKLKIIGDALNEKDPEKAKALVEKELKLAIFDTKFMQAMPHATADDTTEANADLALLTDDQKIQIINDAQKDPANADTIAEKETKLAIFNAKVLLTAKTPEDKTKLAANLALLTDDQKLKIIDDAQKEKDPEKAKALVEKELKLAIFDATVLKINPDMKSKLAQISDADKLKLVDEPESQRADDTKIALFDASMKGMYAQHPELKAKIDQIPRDKKLKLIDAVQAGLKQDPQLLDHINQVMQDHPQAFNTAISALIEDPDKKDQLIGLIAADQMQNKIVDMVGGKDSILGKVVNWICDFLLDGPLGGFIESMFSKFAGSMGGLQSSAAAAAPDGTPALKGTSATFQIAHETVQGAVEDTASGKAYHLNGELDAAEKAELDHDREVKYTYDRAANQTTITSTNRNWALAAAAP